MWAVQNRQMVRQEADGWSLGPLGRWAVTTGNGLRGMARRLLRNQASVPAAWLCGRHQDQRGKTPGQISQVSALRKELGAASEAELHWMRIQAQVGAQGPRDAWRWGMRRDSREWAA